MLPVNIPDSAQNTLGGHGTSGIGGVIEEARGVSDCVDYGLSIFLERCEISVIEASNQLPVQKQSILRGLKE